jgi:uncharacterized coiled-coil protein SlyX
LQVPLQDLRDELTFIHHALDEAESSRDKQRRRERLQEALLASSRALDRLIHDEDIIATLDIARETTAPYQDAIRQILDDSMLFGAFLNAERRLLVDLGVEGALVERLIAALRDARAADAEHPVALDAAAERLRALADELAEAREQFQEDESDSRRWNLVRRSFLVVGGALVVGANALVGAAAAPATGGLSVAGAAVSASLGAVMVDRGA